MENIYLLMIIALAMLADVDLVVGVRFRFAWDFLMGLFLGF